jgi:hypothetical protein
MTTEPRRLDGRFDSARAEPVLSNVEGLSANGIYSKCRGVSTPPCPLTPTLSREGRGSHPLIVSTMPFSVR